MSAIVWDATGERLFETGVDHGVLYPWNSAQSKYDTGVAWNGLTGVTASPDGAEPTDLWADNIKYATLRSAETFGMTIEAYTYPDEFGACDGSASPVSGVYIGQQSRKAFGFCMGKARIAATHLLRHRCLQLLADVGGLLQIAGTGMGRRNLAHTV